MNAPRSPRPSALVWSSHFIPRRFGSASRRGQDLGYCPFESALAFLSLSEINGPRQASRVDRNLDVSLRQRNRDPVLAAGLTRLGRRVSPRGHLAGAIHAASRSSCGRQSAGAAEKMAQLEARPVARISHVGGLARKRYVSTSKRRAQGTDLCNKVSVCNNDLLHAPIATKIAFCSRPASQSASRCKTLHRSRLDKTGGGRLLCRCPPLFYLVRLMGLESRGNRWFSTGTESGPHVRQSTRST